MGGSACGGRTRSRREAPIVGLFDPHGGAWVEQVFDTCHFIRNHPVVLFDHVGITIPIREQRQELGNTALDQMDAGRFQRLEEPAGLAAGNDILVPGLAPAAARRVRKARPAPDRREAERGKGFPPMVTTP
jgi:hypothetical protein